MGGPLRLPIDVKLAIALHSHNVCSCSRLPHSCASGGWGLGQTKHRLNPCLRSSDLTLLSFFYVWPCVYGGNECIEARPNSKPSCFLHGTLYSLGPSCVLCLSRPSFRLYP